MHLRHSDYTVRASVDLDGLKVFIGGPIQHASTDAGFEPTLRDAILTFIAAIGAAGGEVSSAHVTEQFGLHGALFTPDEVTVRDFTWMTDCDVFVPVLPANANGLLRTDGTHIELGWASAMGKPIVLLTSTRAASDASHLVRGLGTIATTTVLDLERTCEHPDELLDVLARHADRTRPTITTSRSASHIDILGMHLTSPVIVGSGLLTDQERNIRRLLECGAGGVITKTIHPNPHNEKPERIAHIRSGMLNSTTYSRRPVAQWCDTLHRFAAEGLPVIASVHADTPDELAALCRDVAATGCRALELGISCINEDGFEDTPERVFAYADAVHSCVQVPFSVKLATADGTRHRVAAAINAGASAVTLSDTIPGAAVDPQTGEIVLGDIYGYSGSGLKPIVLAEILALRRAGCTVPILASGGVQESTDVLEYLSVGANAVQVYTALHRDMYRTLRGICEGLAAWLCEYDHDVTGIIGRSLRKGKS